LAKWHSASCFWQTFSRIPARLAAIDIGMAFAKNLANFEIKKPMEVNHVS
jgi:hypothetical protein